jgi:hypothetical protein
MGQQVMPLDVHSRFLIALAKFLGENPIETDPLREVLVCEKWHLDETLASIIREDGSLLLDEEKFNQLMLHCRRSLVTPHFFTYFFEGVDTIDKLELAIERFRVAAMWLFGNFRFAFRCLATSDVHEFERLLAKTSPRDPSRFENREEFAEIENIDSDDLALLGYVSGQQLDDLAFSLEIIRALRDSGASLQDIYEKLGSQKRSKVSDILRQHGLNFPDDPTAQLDTSTLTKLAEELNRILPPRCVATRIIEAIMNLSDKSLRIRWSRL